MITLPTVRHPKVCTKCDLHIRSNVNCMVGRGSMRPKMLLVGEAPGYEEDKQNLPFVGPAGKELDKLLKDANINIDEVRWTNVLWVS